MKVYIVEIETGSSYDDGAMVFDSVWSTKEKAEEYCKKFEKDPNYFFSQRWNHEIFECTIDEA